MSEPIFTCNACVTQFKSSDLQRYHMKTDWHRYNLKRRIADLLPISSDEFAEKLQTSEREQTKHQVDEFGFPLLKSLPNHHHKHNDGVTKLSKIKSETTNESDIEDRGEIDLQKTTSRTESVISGLSQVSLESGETYGEATASEYGFTSDSNYENDTVDTDGLENDLSDVDDIHFANSIITKCIYCGVENKEINRNVKHMFQNHGLYIPERSYLIDLPGLLNFLYDLTVINYNCLCCNFIGSSLESIRAHMNSKRHCWMPYETWEQRELFEPFYDFSSLQDEDKPKSSSSNSNKKSIRFENVDDAKSDEDTSHDSEEESVGINSNYTRVEIDNTGLELTLPTGARLGHRAGQRFYRQNIPTHETSESRATVTAADRRLVSGITERQFKQGIKNGQQVEKRANDDRLRKEMRRMNFQTHYRDEFLQ
ncbi:similar to Saccharomyces cerevisiae YLR387C REH1 Cytoplasmic 60S subunit biogenesis factor, associates with pre-60S particles [Maudiozyma barnettii]|uniref:Similar to Saccharomyces cerevisiae YLR387C REH1 Cytoplasmic 60S subunit biogenesis factor, associates with pre-60S particles n=1 Tax=Maudiozyma barnettii TaxID=61262 RepID=A0A8H2VL01_9SACH|nr:Reh1p [Kazachstania barnettii]CAB4257264.1 similar to Saccharomyces cerevisiae YLR387C REH1 Cytoplasmic 60S subunit biogenesis factor, associates with pre-60S particles [Kazachstania barnettii]CAD1784529.1 similar to Saccharomyces cerevisiae YLR387C REH1 Cytoplasmic 60S subunit biogenesis factor, associates with pre-60S particles [Kazachstania barnettii]